MSIFQKSQQGKAAGISPTELKAMLESDSPPLLVDVREPWEFGFARIEGAQLLPLGELQDGTPNLPQDRPIVVYCHHGMRGAAAAQLLMQQNYTNVKNLLGGIDRWAQEVDPSMSRY